MCRTLGRWCLIAPLVIRSLISILTFYVVDVRRHITAWWISGSELRAVIMLSIILFTKSSSIWSLGSTRSTYCNFSNHRRMNCTYVGVSVGFWKCKRIWTRIWLDFVAERWCSFTVIPWQISFANFKRMTWCLICDLKLIFSLQRNWWVIWTRFITRPNPSQARGS